MSAVYPPSITRNRPVIVVEQLNGSQWHVAYPDGTGSGVGGYVDALAEALFVGERSHHAVETVDVEGVRMLLAHAGPGAAV